MSTRRRKRHTPEQVVRKLQEADRLLADGADGPEVARQLGVSEQTYYRWRNQFGGLKAHWPDPGNWSTAGESRFLVVPAA
jgi:putative transposase